MLRIHQSGTVEAAKNYFTSGLERNDYYTGSELPGRWRGRAARRLGLEGEVGREEFLALCDNRHPATGEQINPANRSSRKVGYDATFSAPKSVSILVNILGEEAVYSAFKRAVRETMEIVEAQAHVRVRKLGKYEDRKTGNLVWGEFVHFTSRPIDGVCDPQLHAHCYLFNTSYDAEEERFKAGKFYQIKAEAPYYEAVFHSKLAREIARLGFGIENRPFGFEVRGIGEKNIERFSRRTVQIEKLAGEIGAGEELKSSLGAMTRERKSATMSEEELRSGWWKRLDHDELDLDSGGSDGVITAEQAVDLAIEGCFERRSVVRLSKLKTEALQSSLGQAGFEEIEAEIARRENLIVRQVGDFAQLTTAEILTEEREIFAFLGRTRSTCQRLAEHYQMAEDVSLDGDQLGAIRSLLESKDQAFVIEGRAGTGKTTLMREAIRAIERGGTPVLTFAPTSEAAHKVLKGEGFANSNTIQQLLINPTLQAECQDTLIWVDEAGMLSTREMNQLCKIAERQKARLVLSGDTRQHRSVERGDALRIISESGLVETAFTSQIHRQKRGIYKQIVELISKGSPAEGLAKLDRMGAIHVIADHGERLSQIATDYIESNLRHETVLVVSPTHAEGDQITAAIRNGLRRLGELGEERSFTSLQSRNLTIAQRRQAMFYRTGDVVRFHRGQERGQNLRVGRIEGGEVFVEPAKKNPDSIKRTPRKLDLAGAKKIEVYQPKDVPVAIGEKIRLTGNVTTRSGKKLFNGSIQRVAGFDGGEIVLGSGESIGSEFIAHGYVTTSHASQGKTCSKVIISQTALSAPAASLGQFYVSVSRGRDDVAIYTDSKDALLEYVGAAGRRLGAHELLRAKANRKSKVEVGFVSLDWKLEQTNRQSECVQTISKELSRGIAIS